MTDKPGFTALAVKVPLSNLKPLFTRAVSSEGLEDLAQSIKFSGVMQNLVVRASDYGIIAGYRRYLAAKKAGLTEVPAVLVDCDDSEAFRLSLVENIQREDLCDYELSRRLQEFKSKTNFTDEQIAQLVGKSRAWVTNHLRMLELKKLPNVSRETLEKLTEFHARAILAQPEEIRDDLLEEVARIIVERGEPPSVREIERMAKELQKPPEEEVGFESAEEILEAAEKAISEPDADRMVELKTPEDVDKFFDEILKTSTPAAEETAHECPCGCGWTISINWRTREVEWIVPS